MKPMYGDEPKSEWMEPRVEEKDSPAISSLPPSPPGQPQPNPLPPGPPEGCELPPPAAAQWKSKVEGDVWWECTVDEAPDLERHNADVRYLFTVDQVRACIAAALSHQLARIRHLEHERDSARRDFAALAARQAPDVPNQDAARGRYVVENAEWRRYKDEFMQYGQMTIRVPYETNMSSVAAREAALDAAIARKPAQ